MGRQSCRHALNDPVGAGASPWLYPNIPGAGVKGERHEEIAFRHRDHIDCRFAGLGGDG